jgi:N6-adenosine-specific RNA methylase IME4
VPGQVSAFAETFNCNAAIRLCCNFIKMKFMETMQQPAPSVFSQMVDRLKDKSEEELKLLYLKFFGNDLNDEWKEITNAADFNNATEEDIVEAIQKNRYSN